MQQALTEWKQLQSDSFAYKDPLDLYESVDYSDIFNESFTNFPAGFKKSYIKSLESRTFKFFFLKMIVLSIKMDRLYEIWIIGD